MNPRVKKAAILIVKVAILAGILEYARRHSQTTDEIAVPSVDSAAGAVLADRGALSGRPPHQEFVLAGVDGREVRLAPGARLTVVERRLGSPAAGAIYRARNADGSLIDIPASELQGIEGAAPGAPYTLLPSWRTLFANADKAKIGLATLAFGPALFLMAVRLQFLLVATGVRVPFFTLLRLHYLGFFFNSFMPGGAGGDIVKAVYLLRHSAKKEAAATMIFIDRVIGLVGLLLLGGAVVLFAGDRIEGVGFEIGAVSLALGAGSIVFFSAWFRRLIQYDAIISRLPRAAILKKVDTALLSLRDHKGAVMSALCLTIALQLMEVVGLWLAGGALGIHRARFTHYVAFVPIGYLANAIPISFGGVGLMEGAFLKLFRDAGVATATQGFMLGVLARIIVLVWSLLGAVSALFPPPHPEAIAGPTRAAEATPGSES
jgi:glycosyltransferase 2 family protein